MRDYWMTQSLLQVMGWGYVAVVLIALLIAAWAPRRNPHKVVWVLIVLGVGSILPIKSYQQYEEQKQMGEARKQQYAKAKALFDERCKTAGEKIYKTIDNVDGIKIIRDKYVGSDVPMQFRLNNPYGGACDGDSCIAMYLIDTSMVPVNGDVRSGRYEQNKKRIYQFVEVGEGESSELRRYTKLNSSSPLEVQSVLQGKARYGVILSDVSTPEDRSLWIAGGSIKVIDLMTREVLAERTGYLLDPGQGSTDGQRSPWDWARVHGNACPSIAQHNQVFVEKVIRPVKGVRHEQ